MDNRAIGVFDSGLGGLTAAEVLSAILPNEHIVYLADSYNMPYGEKDRDRIIQMSLSDLRFLLEKDVKAVFVACGTATSNALEALERESPVPVFGVVSPAVEAAVKATKNGKVGLLATRASVEAGIFQQQLRALAPELALVTRACPKFATMVEDGIFDKADGRVLAAVEEYLPPLKDADVDTVILGCTHYPLLVDVIRGYMGLALQFISAGGEAAKRLAAFLQEKGLCCAPRTGKTDYYTTGVPESFAHSASLMLGRDIRACLQGIEPFDKAENL